MRLALAERPHRIAPKFFYDAAGSALFDRICELPEYYPTRTELALLGRHAGEMAALIGPQADVVEFGAGSATKIRLLLSALDRPRRFVPIDISAEHLHAAARALQRDHPGLAVQPLAADFTKPFTLPAPAGPAGARRVGFFPGSSIGNFAHGEALTFLRQAAMLLRGGGLLVGVDLVKDPSVLHAAYNDAAGVTAAFNRNLLVRANHELGTDFDPAQFAHYAFYEPRLQRIEMHLVSRRAQTVRLAGEPFVLAEGETLHTENSHKFTVDGFRRLARQAGFEPGPVWCDERQHFSVHWLQAPR
ncbi:L-histidine N(alpha)-methyltransferase [Aquincola sp. MAHUQ-54]|uniref:L-histidine N(Alpha)-methyltransferase n=2 Tax=Sphaerotilaceae TaxID=2975441 RepID=A0AAW9QHU7_9BURK